MITYVQAHPDLFMPIWVAVFALVCALIAAGLKKVAPKLPGILGTAARFLAAVFHILAMQPAPRTKAAAVAELEDAVKQAKADG